MKPSISSVLLMGFAAVASAAKHRHGHAHLHNRASPQQGERVTIVDNSISVPTEIPEIVVFVDQAGVPVRTAQALVVLVPPASVAASVAASAIVSPASTQTAVVDLPSSGFVLPAVTVQVSSIDQQPASSAQPTAEQPTPSSSATPANAVEGSSLPGVAYAPYNADGSCKSASQVQADFQTLAGTYSMVRTYGVDCNQVTNVLASAKATNMKVMLGIFSLDNLSDQVSTLTSAVGSDWSIVDTVSVGNELVNNGQASPSQVINAVNSAREMLRQAGFSGPVVTVDTFVAHLAHPELCQASDYCAANIHPFFDPNTSANQAGVFVANQINRIREKLGNANQRVVVTESGWPWQGNSNGQAVPGLDHQSSAISSIKAAFQTNPGDLVLFSAFNDAWKKAEAATFYAEQYWGIGGADAA